MRAIAYRSKGLASEVLERVELPDPTPGPGEVRVRVHCSGVNPSDTKSRAGVSSASMEYPLIVPHSDGSGAIDRVGAGVARSRIGKRVWIHNGQWQRAHGTASEFVCLPSPQAVDLPDSLPLPTAASFGIPLITAAHAVGSAGSLVGKRVLVTGRPATWASMRCSWPSNKARSSPPRWGRWPAPRSPEPPALA